MISNNFHVMTLGINHGKSLLMVMNALREKAWHLCEIYHETIHIDIDTTVETTSSHRTLYD
ncbi:MAG: hypothetical protein GY775_01880 [Candidatus Scalindua sp.]|nr:hypothetical protein [Candidatus Scalindua sp.]